MSLGFNARALLLAGLLGLAAPAGAETLVYVLDQADAAVVHGYRLTGGELVPVAGSPWDAGDASQAGLYCAGQCQTLALTARKRLLLSTSEDGVSVWRIGADGGLTLVAGSPFGRAGGGYSGVVSVRRAGRDFVYASDFDGDQVTAFEVGPGDELQELAGSPYMAGDGPLAMVAPQKHVLVVASQNDGTLRSFAIANDGALTPAPTPPTGFTGSPISGVQADAEGRFVWVSEGLGPVHGFKVRRNGGALKPLRANPIDANLDLDADSGLSASRGKYVYGARFADGTGNADLQALKRSRKGELKPVGDNQGSGMAFIRAHGQDSKGKRLFVTSGQSSELRAFRIRKRGELQLQDEVALPADNPNGLVVLDR